MENDLRLVELKKREGFQMDARAGVLTVVVVAILLFIGIYVNSKVDNAVGIPTTYSDNVSVCPTCVGYTQQDVDTANSVRTNSLDAFDIQSVGLIILGVSVLVGYLYLMLR